jgi:carbamoyl-phosphate synthase large subunit
MNPPIVALTGMNRGENPQPGYAVACSLRRKYPNMKIVGLIYDAMESGIFATDGPDWAYTIPYPTAGSKALLERLDFVKKRHDFSILIPTLDTEMELMIRLQGELNSRGIQCFLPTLESFQSRAKSQLPKLCEACDCQTPLTKLARDLKEAKDAADAIEYPVMVKGQFYDAKKVQNESELTRAFQETIHDWGTPVLVQESISGAEMNVLGVGDGLGAITGMCSVRKTILSSKGKGISAIIVHDPNLESITCRIIEKLKWRGPFELEFIHDESSDSYKLIEMNPRFPAWVDFPSALGLNFPAQIISMLSQGHSEPMDQLSPGWFYLRHQIETIGSLSQLSQLMTEGVWNKRENQNEQKDI